MSQDFPFTQGNHTHDVKIGVPPMLWWFCILVPFKPVASKKHTHTHTPHSFGDSFREAGLSLCLFRLILLALIYLLAQAAPQSSDFRRSCAQVHLQPLPWEHKYKVCCSPRPTHEQNQKHTKKRKLARNSEAMLTSDASGTFRSGPERESKTPCRVPC